MQHLAAEHTLTVLFRPNVQVTGDTPNFQGL
jgi:hypothetical protein